MVCNFVFQQRRRDLSDFFYFFDQNAPATSMCSLWNDLSAKCWKLYYDQNGEQQNTKIAKSQLAPNTGVVWYKQKKTCLCTYLHMSIWETKDSPYIYIDTYVCTRFSGLKHMRYAAIFKNLFKIQLFLFRYLRYRQTDDSK